MTLTDEGAGFLSSYATAEPDWRRSLLHLEAPPDEHDAFDWPATLTVLGGLPDGGPNPTVVDPVRIIAYRELNGEERYASVPTDLWFDDVHTIPRAIDLGLVVATVLTLVEPFNAYRHASQTWTAWINYGGPGIDIVGEALPEVIGPHSGTAVDASVEVTTVGEPVVDSYMDFVWVSVGTNVVTLRFTRVVPLATSRGFLIPEDDGLIEYLDSLTNVIPQATGGEQLIKIRKRPRQVFEHVYKVPEGYQRAELDLILGQLQHRLFGVGVWEHEIGLLSDAAIGDTVLAVTPSTDYSDFRAAGTLVILIEDGPYELRAIASVASASITLTNGLGVAFPAGARIVPIRSAYVPAEIEGARFPVNLTTIELTFEVEDNEVDIADASAFNSYRGRPLLDDWNFQGKTTPSGLIRDSITIDGGTGVRYRESDERLSRSLTRRTFMTKTRQTNWEVRQLLHYLAGQAGTFYTPSNRSDLELHLKLTSGESTMTIEFSGYTANAQSRSPKNEIRVVNVDGTTVDRGVLSSEVNPDGTEVLTLDDTWPATVEIVDVAHVMFLEKSRFATDRVRIDHTRGGRTMKASAAVRSVLS